MVNTAPGFYNNQQMGGGAFRRGMRGGGRYRPYGGNMGTRINPALCSLLVKKIPPEQNKIVMLDQHFGKFGQITNLHVQFEGQPDTALVTFKTRREAMNAYKSTEPIFNNRFIKVFWQTQPDLPAGGAADNTDAAADPSASGDAEKAGAQPIPTDLNRNFSKTFGSDQATSAPQPAAESKLNSEHNIYDPSAPQQAIPLSSGNGAPVAGTHLKRPVYNPRAMAAKRRAEKESLMKLLELHRLKTELYTKLFEQQKDLLQKIQATENKEIRKKYMTLVKSTSTSMAGAKSEIEKLGEQIKDLQKKQQEAAKKPAFGASFPGSAANNNGNEQRKSSTAGQEEGNENVKTASIPSSPLPPNSSTNKKLFKVVHVSGCPVQSNEDLIVHMESFGELFDFDIAPRNRASPCVFTYKNPADAQRAVAEASNFPQADKLKVEWAPVSLGQHTKVVPDKERKPNEQMTPAALLAALENDDDYDSDNEEDHQNGKNEEEDLELEL
uniref:RRM domain-containing protein n=1 Tax=Ditylenchus dipsaci TaxID=166011 RepID=A0A915EJ20_9BILA